MTQTLTQIAETLKNAVKIKKAKKAENVNIKCQLIYAFNGTGKTRLSREFRKLINGNSEEESDDTQRKFMYYNAFTEDLFYWDNDLENDEEPKLNIQKNEFTNWILKVQGKEVDIINHFQNYTNDKLTPKFNKDFSEVTFSLLTGDESISENIKISKGEESLFIWCIFYSLFEQIIEVLNVAEKDERETNQFDDLEYIFIDDPVSSLDENHLIELAVNTAKLIKSSKSELKFVITTHNPLFYNVLWNEFRNEDFKKYVLNKLEDETFELKEQNNDSPFSYHLYLKKELEKAIESGEIRKYHFNFLRNILEKTSTFLGKDQWADLLPKLEDGKANPYETRIINISSHSQHSGEEVYSINENDKRILTHLIKKINEIYNIKIYDTSTQTAGRK